MSSNQPISSRQCCCSVLLQCVVAVCCCSVLLQCVVAVCYCSVPLDSTHPVLLPCVAVCCCSVLLYCVIALCCSVLLQCVVAMCYCLVLPCVAVCCCSVFLPCVAVCCCSMLLQCVVAVCCCSVPLESTHPVHGTCHTYTWDMSPIHTCHITHVCTSHHTYEWDIQCPCPFLTSHFLCMTHAMRGGGLGSSTIFKAFNEPYAPS